VEAVSPEKNFVQKSVQQILDAFDFFLVELRHRMLDVLTKPCEDSLGLKGIIT